MTVYEDAQGIASGPLLTPYTEQVNTRHPMTLTKQQALYIFRNEHQGVVRGDVTYTRENWNNFTDYLCKNGKISNHQYNTWTNPF